jgi:hypothetical protein
VHVVIIFKCFSWIAQPRWRFTRIGAGSFGTAWEFQQWFFVKSTGSACRQRSVGNDVLFDDAEVRAMI